MNPGAGLESSLAEPVSSGLVSDDETPRPHRIAPSAGLRTGGEALRSRTYSRDIFGPEVPRLGTADSSSIG
jgi:hypothetical protein